ncbi:MAG: TrkH family potassium uptake protein [Capnocytophaga sp.]|nr:TrkH family potassium uptake protein [Capnocytophaga sp.]
MNYKIITYLLGLLLLLNGGFMLLSALVSVLYKEDTALGMFLSVAITLLLGGLMLWVTRKHSKKLDSREGYIIVTMGWVAMSLSGMLPYLLTGATSSLTDAFFETMSGYTTTGATIFNDVEILPKGVLFWRSITHWIGGMGIIVLTIAILPLLGIGGMQLFVAEAPGIKADKLHPRITDTAKRLWYIYVSYTFVETLLLWWAGMSFFDAINHSLSTLSSGGFSTKNLSLAYWNDQPLIQYIVVAFMFLAGANFVLSYFFFKGKFDKVFADDELKTYVKILLFSTIIVAFIVYFQASFVENEYNPQLWGRAEATVRHSLFSVVSVITTTGFVTADYSDWTPFLKIFFFALMFIGASAGSTAGGIKIVRHLLMWKNSMYEFRRAMHPSAIIPVRFNQRSVSRDIMYKIMAFFVLYVLLFLLGALVLGFLGSDFETALGGAATSLGNIGPGLGKLNPLANFNDLNDLSKWWCAFLMLTGRLEIFTVLILFSPSFWRND